MITKEEQQVFDDALNDKMGDEFFTFARRATNGVFGFVPDKEEAIKFLYKCYKKGEIPILGYVEGECVKRPGMKCTPSHIYMKSRKN